MKSLSIILFFISSCFLCAQPYEVLVFHKTNQFRHGSINAGITMVTDLGNNGNRWNTTSSTDSSLFTASDFVDANGIYKYDVIIFCNTSGNNLLTAAEQIAFEGFIQNGGGFVGIHAATDTYRNGSWPFYNELVGAIVQTSPNHTPNNTSAIMNVQTPVHPVVNHLGSTWTKSEEYYYWELNGGQLSTDNEVLLEVQSTGNNSYDAARPITWLKEQITVNGTTFTGIRSFYTALGHNSGDYTNNTNFRTMLDKAILWAAGDGTLHSETLTQITTSLFPNPASAKVYAVLQKKSELASLRVYDVKGQEMNVPTVATDQLLELDVSLLASGIYWVALQTGERNQIMRLIKR